MWTHPKFDFAGTLRRYRKTVRRLLRLEGRAEAQAKILRRATALLKRLAELQQRLQPLGSRAGAAILSSLFVGAMTLSPFELLAQAPKIVSLAPSTNSMAAYLHQGITISFDRPMDIATLTTATQATHANLVIYGSQSGYISNDAAVFFSDNNKQVHIRTAEPFKPGERLDVTIRGAQSTTGVTMANSTVFQFHTESAGGDNMIFRSTAFGFHNNTRNSRAVEIGDLDGDGDLDAVIGDWDAWDKVWLNNGDATFSVSELPVGNKLLTRDLKLADIDSDGDLDIVVSRWDMENLIWTNNGDATFTSTEFGNSGIDNTGVSVGDIDGDGDLDIATLSENLDDDALFLNKGDGSLKRVKISNARYQGQTDFADLDNDGDLDFQAVGRNYWSYRMRNNGAGSFQGINLSAPTNSNGNFYDIRQGDFDGDRTIDTKIMDYHYGSADIDGDGDLDEVASGGCTFLHLNNGDNTFQGSCIKNGGISDIEFGDLDGDGDLDAIAAVWGNNTIFINEIAVTQLALTPEANRNDVSRNSDITVRFNTAMTTASLSPINTSVHVHGSLTGLVTQASVSFQDGDKTALFNPDNNFLPGEIISITSQGAKSTAGTVAHNPIVSQFRAQAIGGSGEFTSVDLQAWVEGAKVALGDFNKDGLPEALIVDETEVWRITPGSAGAHSISRLWIAPGTGATVQAADFDGDGDLDAVLSRHNYPPLRLLNNGQAHFTATPFGPTLSVNAFAAGDIDADGDIDILAATDNDLSLLRNDGSAVFTHSTLATGSYIDVKLGDVNGDGIPDAFAARRIDSSDQPAEIWLGNGDGTFNIVTIASGRFTALAMGDLDNDGDLDLFAGTDRNFKSRLFLNNGNAIFTETLTGSDARGNAVEIADIDGDGDLDVVQISDTDPDQVMFNNGDASFTISTKQELGSSDLAIGDLDRDNDLDFVSSDGSRATQFYNDDPLPYVRQISPSTHSNTAASNSNITLSYSANTRLELLELSTGTANNEIGVFGSQSGHITTTATILRDTSGSLVRIDPARAFYSGETIMITARGALNELNQTQISQVFSFNAATQQGTGAFYPLSLSTGPSNDVAIGDLNGDGKLDAIVTADDGAAAILLNLGDGSFSVARFGDDNNRLKAVALGDVDGDGDLDVALSNTGDRMGEIWMNSGNAAFTKSIVGAGSGRRSTDVAIGDVDGDGNLDVVWAAGSEITVGYSDGSSLAIHTLVTGTPQYLALGDLNQDQRLDILASYGTGGLILLTNKGAANFAQDTLDTNIAGALALGDLNNDGILDALFASKTNGGSSHSVHTLLGKGDGTFIKSSSGISANVNDITLGDLNADGRLDALVTTDNADEFWLNRGNATFDKRVRGGGASKGAALGDIDNDGALEAIVARAGDERIWQNLVAPPTISSLTPAVTTVTSGSISLDISGHQVYITRASIAVVNSTGVAVGSADLRIDSAGLTSASLTIPAGLAVTAATVPVTLYTDVGHTSATMTFSNDRPRISTSQTVIASDEDVPALVTLRLEDVWPGLNNAALTLPATDGSTIASISQTSATGATTSFLITPAQDASVSNLPLTFRLSDGEFTASTTLSLTVNPLNDPPVVSVTRASVSTDEDTSTSISIQLFDVDTPLNNLNLSASSSSPALVSDGGFSFGAIGATTRVNIYPNADAFGQADITVFVNDGETTRSTTFTLNVLAVNDPPVVSVESLMVTTDEDTSTSISISVVDVDSPLVTVSLSATSNNQSLVVNSGLILGAAAETTSLTIDPVADANGQADITVFVNDGQHVRSTTFTLDVQPVNDAPLVSVTKSTVTTDEDTSTSISIQLFDIDTPLNNLSLSASSSNPTLVTNGGFSFGATGATTQLIIHPEADAFGQADITLFVNDGEFLRSTSFTLNVLAINDPPVVSVERLTLTTNEDTSTSISISVVDVDSPLVTLSQAATSNNQSIVANSGLTMTATGANTSLLIDPVADANGQADITVFVNDGEFVRSTTFTVNVLPVNDAPLMSVAAAAVVTDEDASTTLSIIVADVDTHFDSLLLSAVSDNPAVLATSGISFGVTGATTQVMLSPVADASGTAEVTITLSDGELSASTSLSLSVNAVNDPPTIGAIQDISFSQNDIGALALVFHDIDTSPTGLTVTATSGNQSLIKDSKLAVDRDARSLTLSPECDQTGTALITVSIDDGEFTRSTSFSAAVLPLQALSIKGPTAICPNVHTVYSAEPDISTATHSWSAAGGDIIGQNNASSVTVRWKDGSNGSLSLLRSYANGCTSASMILVTGGASNIAAMDFAEGVTNAAVTLAVLANDLGSGLTLSAVDDPAGGTATFANGIVSYTPDTGFYGIEYFTYTAQSSGGCQVTGAIVVAVPGPAKTVNPWYIERKKDRVGGVRGLRSACDVAISPDGRYVYVAGRSDHSIAIFETKADGSLTYKDRVRDNNRGVDGLKYVSGLAICPDGRHLYASGYGEHELAVFAIDRSDGSLSFVQVKKQASEDNGRTINGMSGPRGLAVSPDGRSVYVAGFKSHALAVFRRNTQSGELEFLEFFKDGVGGVNGLRQALNLAVSSDGRQVLVAGYGDNALALFSRSLHTGLLTFDSYVKDGVGGVDGLRGAAAVAVSPDGRNVYAAGKTDKAIAVFTRNSSNGELSFVQHWVDGDGCDGLYGIADVAVSPDGCQLWSVGNMDDALTLFRRDKTDGTLSYVGSMKDGRDGVDGLNGAAALALTPASNYVYCAATADHALSAFLRNCAPVANSDMSLSVAANGSLTIEALNNDDDAENQSLSISAATDGALGTVSIAGGGTSLRYAAGTSTGADTFSYTIDDGYGGSSTATVSLQVVLPKRSVDNRATAGEYSEACQACDLRIGPNPARDIVGIAFSLGRESQVCLRIVTLSGVSLSEIMNRRLKPGAYKLNLNTQGPNLRLPAGSYMIELSTIDADGEPLRISRPMIIVR